MAEHIENDVAVEGLELERAVNAADERIKDILESYVSGGYVTHLAQVLCYLGKGSDRAERALASFDPPMQEKLRSLMEEHSDDQNNMDVAAFVLNQSDFNQIEQIRSILGYQDAMSSAVIRGHVERLMKTNPLLAVSIDENAVLFEDLLNIDDRAIQKVLREVDTLTLAGALHDAPEEVSDKIFRNMSRRAASMLREDIEFMGPVREQTILERRQEIVAIMRRLIDAGEILIDK